MDGKRWVLGTDDDYEIFLASVAGPSTEPRVVEYNQVVNHGEARKVTVSWHGLTPDLQEPTWLGATAVSLNAWATGVRYLASPRRLVQSPFRPPDVSSKDLGIDGHNAPNLLAASDALHRRVRSWYRDTFGVALELRDQGEFKVLQIESDAMGSIALENAGAGLAQILPVVVQALTASDMSGGVDIVEHPESELHPGAHGAVAELLLERCRATSRPLIVETHSEMLLLRARRWVAEGRIPAEDVRIYWIDDEGEKGTHAKHIPISTTGQMTGWPENVFYEDYEEILAIQRAAREST